jgi:pyruvate carboxylase
MRTIFFELNGQPREAKIHDRSLGGKSRTSLPKADRDNPKHVGAPMPGKIATVAVSLGQAISKGDKLLSIEAMKMETSVYCPIDGKIAKIVTPPGSIVASGDLLIELE